MRCSATCLTGLRCKRNVKFGDSCWTHSPKEMSECTICLEDSIKTSKYNIKLDCKHVFCKICIFTWIIEKEINIKCPTCRASINKYIVENAMQWGEKENILYRQELTIYPLDKLNQYELNYMNIFFIHFRSMVITEIFFQNISKIMKELEETNLIFEKLKLLSYKVYPLIKKNNFQKLHMFF